MLSVDGDTISVEEGMNLSARIDKISVATTRNAAHSAAIAAQVKDLFAVVTLSSGVDLREQRNTLGRKMRMLYRGESGSYESIALQALPEMEQRDVITLPPGVADDDVVVFQGGIPQGVNARTIRAEFNYEISAEEHFCTGEQNGPCSSAVLRLTRALLRANLDTVCASRPSCQIREASQSMSRTTAL